MMDWALKWTSGNIYNDFVHRNAGDWNLGYLIDSGELDAALLFDVYVSGDISWRYVS